MWDTQVYVYDFPDVGSLHPVGGGVACVDGDHEPITAFKL